MFEKRNLCWKNARDIGTVARMSVRNKFSSKISQRLLIAGAWNFTTFSVYVFHMMGLFFLQIKRQLLLKKKRLGNFKLYFSKKKIITDFSASIISRMLEMLIHSLLERATWWDSFLNLFNVYFLLNVDFPYFIRLHQSGGTTSEYWITDILFDNVLFLRIFIFLYQPYSTIMW